MTGLYGVAGNPVLHSRSPQMHNAAFRKLGIDAAYVRLAAVSAEEALGTAREMGLLGLNVTSPFKEEMAGIVEAADESARKLGAVNTVVIREGKIEGHNTDPDGVGTALRESGVELRGAKAVVIGAGGAAKAAALALLNNGASVRIANRTAPKAEKAAQELGCGACGMEELDDALSDAEVLVSALSTIERVVRPESLRKGLAVLEANYSSETSLSRDARSRGCKIVSGLDWLLFQGAKAFGIFTGKEPPVAEMRNALYSAAAGDRGPEAKGERIALIGMMGSGKDTVARALGARTGKEVLDVDSMVEKRAGKEISRIFSEDGEAAFRKMEEKELLNSLGQEGIINCGGGAVLGKKGRELVKARAVSVWLWASPETLASRIRPDGTRPLLGTGDSAGRLAGILRGRMGAYADASDMVINTGSCPPERAAERIMHEIH